MIQKEKAVELLSRLIQLQKELIPLLNRHLTASIELSGLPQTERQKVSDFLKRRAVMQASHLETLEGTLRSIRESKRDVF